MRGVPKSLRFLLERWIQRGALFQLAFVAGLVVLVACLGGLVAFVATEEFERLPDAIWWSFLRLTDPGYLGDDAGVRLRTISTVQTVLGYVLFMGSLIAILTQWLALKLRQLESGLTPISMSGHVVILGWTNRTPELVAKLLASRGRLRRFLRQRGVRDLRIVVLTDEVDAERRHALHEYVGKAWRGSRIFLRSGSVLEPRDLQRLDLLRASAVLVPGSDFELGGAELTDMRVIKALLTLRRILREAPDEEHPVIVAEIFDSAKLEIAQETLPGELELVSSDSVISRLISQSLRHQGLAEVFIELLSHREGSSIYVRNFPELAGQRPVALNPRFPEAIVLGAVRREGRRLVAYLGQAQDFRLEPDDLLVLLARSYDEAVPGSEEGLAQVGERPPLRDPGAPARRVLILGLSHKVGAILRELGSATAERFEVTLVSRASLEERAGLLQQAQQVPANLHVEHRVADHAVPEVCRGLAPETYDSVVFLASAFMATSEEADARTILSYVMLRSLLAESPRRPEVLLELLDPMNSSLLADAGDTQFVSPRLLSHLLAHVALRPELNSAYTALFVTGGAEVALLGAPELGLTERPVTFAEIERIVLGQGSVALGLLLEDRPPQDRIQLNPERTRPWTLGQRDAVVVMSDYD